MCIETSEYMLSLVPLVLLLFLPPPPPLVCCCPSQGRSTGVVFRLDSFQLDEFKFAREDKQGNVLANRRKITGFMTIFLRDPAVTGLVLETGIPYTFFAMETPNGHVFSRLGAAKSIDALKHRLLLKTGIGNVYRQTK
jgi:hypothetical protein